ncbi:hypothetical protein B5V88_07470 [Heyndrickxia sporothermodurans]|nr:hypothetical protein B5V88_07470 [Heyndrickxia sporothermodurans]PTY86363.1 hypothetical protein B5V91_06215 [Heyndrickxia sporothermodurans]PTY94595.1 hypothetical protein B5V90_00930 [Heyndrickxia sporothermodurans]
MLAILFLFVFLNQCGNETCWGVQKFQLLLQKMATEPTTKRERKDRAKMVENQGEAGPASRRPLFLFLQ